MQAVVLAPGVAAAVAVEARQGLARAGLQGSAQDIDGRRAPGAALFGRLIEHGLL